MKSVTSGILVKAKFKQRQSGDLETATANASARKPNVPALTTSKKRSAARKDTAASSSDKVFDLAIGSNFDPLPILEEQRKDIDHILTSVYIMQQDMISLQKDVRELQNSRNQTSQDIAADVDLLTDGITKVGSSLSELDTLKVEMKLMQQRIKRMEGSRSTGRQSLRVLDSARVSRPTSPTIDEVVTSHNDGPSNASLSSGTRHPLSVHLNGSSETRKTASERHDLVDGSNLPFQGLRLDSKAKTLPQQKSSTTKPRTSINGTASKGILVPPPKTPHREADQNVNRRRSSAATDVAFPFAAPTSVKGTMNSIRLPKVAFQTQAASTGFYHNHQEDHTYDDELVDDIRPQSSTKSLTGNVRRPASTTAHSRPDRTIQRPTPERRAKAPALARTQQRAQIGSQPRRPP